MHWKAPLVALLCVVAGLSMASPKPELTNKEWTHVCEQVQELGYTRVNCKKIDRPILVVSKVVDEVAAEDETLYGFTIDSEPYIFVNSRLLPQSMDDVIVHETTHYVLGQFYGAITECESEEAARRVAASWANYEYTDDWRLDYGC